ncbi:hypothetical protein [Fodinicurvata sp. EGI_FJ10296]|uniref:hypothetical protein n=1 Tax=Fodinicurvata sp. EGI_FJ10296 TaxID=3231908 RepID=UPI0034548821
MSSRTTATIEIAALDRLSAPVRRMNDAIQRMTSPIGRLTRSVRALSRETGFSRLGAQVADVQRRLMGLGAGVQQSIGRLGQLSAIAGLGGGGAAAALFTLTNRVSEQGDELIIAARRLGMGTDALQRLRFAAEETGVGVATFDRSIERLGRSSQQAIEGNDNLRAAFGELGVRVQEEQGNIRETDQLLYEMADALAAIEDPTRRAYLAQQLMGRSGRAMVDMMADGSAGLEDLGRQAEETGNIFSDDALDSAQAYQGALGDLSNRVTGLRNRLGLELMPVIQDVIERLGGWLAANQDLIQSRIEAWVGRFAQVMADLADPASDIRVRIAELTDGLATAWDAFSRVSEVVGGPLNGALLALGGYVLTPVIAATVSLATGLIGLAGALSTVVTGLGAMALAAIRAGVAFMMTPIGWITAGIAAVAGAAYLIYQHWEPISAWFAGMWAWVKETAGAALSWITDFLWNWNPGVIVARAINGIVEALFGIDLFEVGRDWIGRLAEGIAERWQRLTAWLREAISGLTAWMPDWVKERLGIEVTATPLTDDEIDARAAETARRETSGQGPGPGAGYDEAFARERDRLRAENARLREEAEAGLAVPELPTTETPAATRAAPDPSRYTVAVDVPEIAAPTVVDRATPPRPSLPTLDPADTALPEIDVPTVAAPATESSLSALDAAAPTAGIGTTGTDPADMASLTALLEEATGTGAAAAEGAAGRVLGEQTRPVQITIAPGAVQVTAQGPDPDDVIRQLRERLPDLFEDAGAAARDRFND